MILLGVSPKSDIRAFIKESSRKISMYCMHLLFEKRLLQSKEDIPEIQQIVTDAIDRANDILKDIPSVEHHTPDLPTVKVSLDRLTRWAIKDVMDISECLLKEAIYSSNIRSIKTLISQMLLAFTSACRSLRPPEIGTVDIFDIDTSLLSTSVIKYFQVRYRYEDISKKYMILKMVKCNQHLTPSVMIKDCFNGDDYVISNISHRFDILADIVISHEKVLMDMISGTKLDTDTHRNLLRSAIETLKESLNVVFKSDDFTKERFPAMWRLPYIEIDAIPPCNVEIYNKDLLREILKWDRNPGSEDLPQAIKTETLNRYIDAHNDIMRILTPFYYSLTKLESKLNYDPKTRSGYGKVKNLYHGFGGSWIIDRDSVPKDSNVISSKRISHPHIKDLAALHKRFVELNVIDLSSVIHKTMVITKTLSALCGAF